MVPRNSPLSDPKESTGTVCFILSGKFQLKAEKITGLDFHKGDIHFIIPTKINSLEDFFLKEKEEKGKNVGHGPFSFPKMKCFFLLESK